LASRKVLRFISKGKKKNRKVIPLAVSGRKKKRPAIKGVVIKSVSLEPKAILKINKKTIQTLNKGQPANFSSSLNKIVVSSRFKRDFKIGDKVKVDGRKGKIVGGSAGHPAVEFDDGGEARNVFVEAVERAKKDTISKGLLIQKTFETPEGTKDTKLFLKSNKWDNLSKSQRESTLDVLGLENIHSRKQLAELDFNDLTNFWKNQLRKEGFKDEI